MIQSKRMAMCLAAGVLLAAGGTVRAQDASVLDTARETLAKWVETQRVISEERRNWEEGKEILDRRIALLESEIKTLEARIAESRSGVDETAEERAELAERRQAFDRAAGSLESFIPELESKTRRLVASLPAGLQSKIAPLSQRIPEDPKATRLTLGQRYQNVIGVLNEVNKFNRDISVTSEIRAMPDGTTAEVRALYVGLGQGYYVTPDGTRAGIGQPSEDGWNWVANDSLAPQIAEAIAILENEKAPAYVPLPVEIR
jgi:hypothetical protein